MSKVKPVAAVFSAYNEQIQKKAFEIINTTFPQKIAEIRAISEGQSAPTQFCTQKRSLVVGPRESDSDEVSTGPAQKKRKIPTEVGVKEVIDLEATAGKIEKVIYKQRVEANKHIVQVVRILKPLLGEMVECVNKVKSWIQLNIPRIEDGHNLGVSIQEEILKELSQAEDHVFGMLDSISKYHQTRAKLATKLIKYPGIEDYTNAVHELDEMEWLHLRLTLDDLTQSYAVLFDRIHKNWERLEKPRPAENSHITMY